MTPDDCVRLAGLIADRAGDGRRRERQGDLLVDGCVEAVRVALTKAVCAGRVDGLVRDKTLLPGRKPLSAETKAKVLAKTAREMPPDATHWHALVRVQMAKGMGISRTGVQHIWAEAGLKPHLTRTFKGVERSKVRGVWLMHVNDAR